MSKMKTVRKIAAGSFPWKNRNKDVARIEKNLFALDGETFEALRFCKSRNGRHNRIHLVVSEEEFVALFEDSVRNGVFTEPCLWSLYEVLGKHLNADADASWRDKNPFLKVVGIGDDGALAQRIDEELYGEKEK